MPWPNAFVLITPLIVWNVVLWPRLPDDFPNDEGVPSWLLRVELILRIAVFAGPLLLAFGWDSAIERIGLALYALGTVVYFASWLPHVQRTRWASRPVAALAPYATPLLPLLGIALAARSIPYGVVAVLFVAAHTTHGHLAWTTQRAPSN